MNRIDFSKQGGFPLHQKDSCVHAGRLHPLAERHSGGTGVGAGFAVCHSVGLRYSKRRCVIGYMFGKRRVSILPGRNRRKCPHGGNSTDGNLCRYPGASRIHNKNVSISGWGGTYTVEQFCKGTKTCSIQINRK